MVAGRPSPPTGAGTSGPVELPSSLLPRQDNNNRQPQSSLAERRGKITKPLPDSPGPETPDKEGLFQKQPRRGSTPQVAVTEPSRKHSGDINQNRQHWPTPTTSISASATNLQAPAPSNVNRLGSNASTSTTKAQRGSPPPPETPASNSNSVIGSDIEARYAAAGIAGPGTLSSLQAHSAASHQRANVYSQQPRQQHPIAPQQTPTRPWTPTEQPGTQPYGPPRIYQGPTEVTPNTPTVPQPAFSSAQQPTNQPSHAQRPSGSPSNSLEDDFHRLNMTSSPPPAYSSLGPVAVTSQGYPNEKQGVLAASHPAPMGSMVSAAMGTTNPPATTNVQAHPAFANDPRQQAPGPPTQQNPQEAHYQFAQVPANAPVYPTPAPTSPPPLPEGWIAHIDPSSGQYYYIHLPTQSTQWEFPKGPTPLNLTNPPISPAATSYVQPITSPGLSTFGKPMMSPAFSVFGQPIASPGLPGTPGYEGSVMSMGSGYSGPPPSSGVELYKVAPTNGVYFGPYLRYTNMDMERGLWFGSILLVTDAPQPPTIHIHQSVDLSPNPRQLTPTNIHVHQRWAFYKYSFDLQMEDSGPAKWTYAITSHLGCTRYEFLVAGRHETNWRFIATSGNDFSLNVSANERARLGGPGYLWKDIMQKHVECGGFHAQLGLGSQINADRLWKEVPSLRQWLTMSGKEARKNAAWTASHEDDVTHAYFHYYTSHFDQPYLREAFAQIPQICQVDDHDMCVAHRFSKVFIKTLTNLNVQIRRIRFISRLYAIFQYV